MSTPVRWIAAAAAITFVFDVAAADAKVFGKPQLGTFPTIQGAIDAAAHGDVVPVESGSAYAGFTIDNKALTVMPESAAPITVNGMCAVRNLGPARAVSLIGLKITGDGFVPSQLHGLELTSNLGNVRIQSCTLKGGRRFHWPFGPVSVGYGVVATGNSRVIFSASTLLGADCGFNSGNAPDAGADGMHAVGSSIALYDCTLRGGVGSHETYPAGGRGGDACYVEGFGVFTSGVAMYGGMGGGGDYLGCTDAGDGGDALVLEGAQIQMLDTLLTPGSGQGFYTCNPGTAGQTIASNGGVVNALTGASRSLSAPMRATDNAVLSMTLTDQPGDKALLLISPTPQFVYSPMHNGVFGAPGSAIALKYAGTIGPTGVLDVRYPIGDLTGPAAGWVWHVQVICRGVTRARYLTPAQQVLIENT